MKKIKSMVLALTIVSLFSVVGYAYAAEYNSPIEILSNLTKMNLEEINEQRDGKSLGMLAKEKGVLEEFKKQMLENKKIVLAEKVKENFITQDEADAIIARIEANMTNCDGNSIMKTENQGLKLGMGKGKGLMKNGQGNGQKNCVINN